MSDSATTAWVNAVVAAGGTVSVGREAIVDRLIVSLKADGIWSKLDRLWLFAAENTQSALIDLKATATAIAQNSPAFTANKGYKGNGSNAWIDSNLANNWGGGNFSRNSACFFAWNNTAGADTGGLAGTALADRVCSIVPQYTDNNLYGSVCQHSGSFDFSTVNNPADTGLYLANRTGSTAATIDINGVQKTTSAQPSTALSTTRFSALVALGGGNWSNRQCSCLGLGGSLSSGERTAIHDRLLSYMASIGNAAVGAYTLAGSAATFVRTLVFQKAVSTTGGATSRTLPFTSIASAAGQERLVALFSIVSTYATAVTYSNVQIDGQTATQVGSYTGIADSVGNGPIVSFWRAPGTASTSINVTFNIATGTVFDARGVLWNLNNAGTLLDFTGATVAINTGGINLSLDIDTVANGAVAAAFLAYNKTSGAATWTGLTERHDGIANTLYGRDWVGAADLDVDVSTGSTPLTVTANLATGFDSGSAAAGLAVSFNPSTGTTLTAAAGGYTVTGASAGLAGKAVAASGSYAITGTAAALLCKQVAAAGSYTITGATAALQRGHVAGAGSHTLTGSAATLLRKQVAGAGSHTLTGTAATFVATANLVFPAAASSYTLTGSAAAFLTGGNAVLPTDPGAYTLTGTAAGFITVIPVTKADVLFAGQTTTIVDLVGTQVIPVGKGDILFTGQNIAISTTGEQPPILVGGGGVTVPPWRDLGRKKRRRYRALEEIEKRLDQRIERLTAEARQIGEVVPRQTGELGQIDVLSQTVVLGQIDVLSHQDRQAQITQMLREAQRRAENVRQERVELDRLARIASEEADDEEAIAMLMRFL